LLCSHLALLTPCFAHSLLCSNFVTWYRRDTGVLPVLQAEGRIQVAEEPLATAFDVLGVDSASRLLWLASYESKAGYYHRDHMERSSRNECMGKLFATAFSGNPMEDMAGGYVGPILHLESTSTATSVGLRVVFSVLAAKDAAGARLLLETLKVTLGRSFAAGKLARVTIVPPGGEQPGGNTDECMNKVMVFRTFATDKEDKEDKEDEEDKEDTGRELADEVKALCEEQKEVVFEAAEHNSRTVAPGDPPGQP